MQQRKNTDLILILNAHILFTGQFVKAYTPLKGYFKN